MPTTGKRQLALPASLSKELDQLARREGKSPLEVLKDLVSENKHKRLEQELKAIQGYWSKKAKALSPLGIFSGISRNREK